MNHRRRLRSSTCLSAAALLCMLPQLALANPEGGVVSAGSASIATSGNTLTVNQTSNKAVIDWRGFDIGAGETTQFVQPGSTSIALNRVNSNSASRIDGNLTANGNVIIVNQNGVLFGGGAKVDVNGLVASTADIDNNKFMNSTGALTFDKAGNPNAVIANAGQITAKEAGLVGLVAPNVINSGVITAKLGRVHLASGDMATVDLYGDGLMDVAVSGSVQSQLVANRGLISADGGTVALTAAAGRDIINSLIDQSGALQAQSVDVKNGKIVIAAESSNSKIKFSGTAKANGNTHGNGGKVTIIGKGDVDFTGTVEAMGGTQSGDGGFVETSGHTLSVSGNVNASASNGNAGTWLLDPATINIITGGSSSSLTASSIDPSYIVSSLNGTNITLTADESITVTNAIDASGNASAGNLTLNAPTTYLNAAITLKSGSILSGNPTTVNVGATGKVQNGVDVAADNATVNLSAATYNLAQQVLIAKSLTVNGNGAILDGQSATRVMEIDGTNSGITVNLNNLTLQHGNGNGADRPGWGGALLVYAEGSNQATVNISNSSILDNSTTYGGGILNNGSDSGHAILTISDSIISNNTAYNNGGGIDNFGADSGHATTTINNSKISGNSANGGHGGGVVNDARNGSATLTISNSTILGNSSGAFGGGVMNDGSSSGNATSTINNSTISGNSTSDAGGAIFNYGGVLAIGNSTILNNSANRAGAVYNYSSATAAINNSTITANSATGNDGGIINDGATLTISNTILAANMYASSESDYITYSGGTLTSLGYNLFGQNGNAGGFVGNGTTDILLTGGINTVLSALADNGGPTKTMALVSGSAAIGAGGANSGYQIDQRGLARKLTGQISIGAYEYAPEGNPFIITSTVDPSSNTIGTLRTALNYVNANPFFNPIITFDSYFDIARTITLAQGQLLISGNMTLDGPWSGLTLDAHNASRVMEIDGSAAGVNVTLNRLTLENGNGVGTNFSGAGGGLLVYSQGSNNATVNINNSTFLNNYAASYGGGIESEGGSSGHASMTLNNSTFSGNTATYGAGIFNGGYAGNATMTINNSTISDNTASGNGGGIFNEGAGSGTATLTINNSTISGNSASGNGGGIINDGTGGGSAPITIANTIIAGNTLSGSEADFANSSGGTLTSLGYNLFGQNGNAGGFTGNGTTDILLTGGINTVLSALADNGGSTKTMALVSGSVAIGAGGATTPYALDQRGFARALSGNRDIGAYEYNAVNPFLVTSTADQSGLVLGTLRTAFDYANNTNINPTISFDATAFATPQTISPVNGQFVISSSLTLNGSNAGVTLDAHNASRVMEIDGSTTGVNVTLNRLTLTGGNGVGANSSGNGGGLLVYSQTGNHATVNISNSTISNNQVSNWGGAIMNDGSTNGHSTITISNSTISGNSADGYGGTIFNNGQDGGNANLTINSSTISGNSSTSVAGGIFNDAYSGTASVTIGNTIVANNTVNGSESNYQDFYSSTFTSLGHNLFGQSGVSGGFGGNGTTDILLTGAINTVLSALADNGGPTKTMALVVGSAAYKAGGAVGAVTTDQRGESRGSTISIGAYDYAPVSLVVNSIADTVRNVIGGAVTTLRDALYYSNIGAIANPTITFDSSVFNSAKTISLTQGQLLINSSLTVNGTVYGVTLDAHNASRVMEIDGTSSGITVNLNRLTLTNGNGVGTSWGGVFGGGLFVFTNVYSTTVNINDSTFLGNTTLFGGAIAHQGNNSSAITLNNSTFTGNSAGTGGGALYSSAPMLINNTTISGNTTTGNGGGIYNNGSTIAIGNTILAGNTDNGSGSADFWGAATSNGYNLFGQNGNAGGFVGNGTTDILLTGNINTVLSALADNGGPTRTMALKLGSVAIDAGDPSQISQLDQRGFTRGSSGAGTGTHADIGAYEAAILNVSADDQEIIYGQSAPSLTYTLNSGPTGHLSGNLAFITNYTNVGTYAGDIGIGTLAADNGYLLDFTAGQYKIDPRTVTIIPTVGQSKIYGSVDPTLFYNTATATGSTGLVNSDTLSGSINYSGAGQYTNVGNYAFTLGNLSNSNYSIVMAGSPPTFAINARTVTIAANAQSATYGDTLGLLNYATSGLVGSDVFTGSLTTAHGGTGTVLSHANGFDVTGSPFAITQGSLAINDGNGGNNYAINYTGNNVTLGAKAATVTAEAASRNQGAGNPTFTAIISGFVGGEVLGTSGITGTPDFTTLANGSSVAGEYAITPSLGTLAANNYSFSPFIDGVLTVTPMTAIPSSVLRVSQNPEILSGNSGNRWDAPDVAEALNDARNGQTYLSNSAPLSLQNRLRYWLDSMHGLLSIAPELAKRLNLSETQLNEL